MKEDPSIGSDVSEVYWKNLKCTLSLSENLNLS